MAAATAYSPRHDFERILEIGVNARDGGTFQREALDFLGQSIGTDSAFFARFEPVVGLSAEGVVTVGMASGYQDLLIARTSRYERELAPVKNHAMKNSGVAVDTGVLGSEVRKTRYYDDLVRPVGGGHSLMCFLQLRGQPLGLLMLGRESSRPFRDQDLDRVRALRPALTLALASSARSSPPNPVTLTNREREIASYLRLGYTNRDIGCALGISPHTVRNQLAALFRKVEVSNRAELVGRLLGH
jgi:DNA-binding CsgD family transcriptional regulator